MKTTLKILARLLFLSIAVPLMVVGFFVATVVRGIRAGGEVLDDFVRYIA